jgi:hypothetical protein
LDATLEAVVIGTLLAGAAAMGLSLYAALALPGVASYLGAIELPGALAGLATPLVWGTLIALALLEMLLSRIRLLDLTWNALHTVVRPPAAALFTAAALHAAPRGLQWLLAVAASIVALLVHLSVLAVHTAARSAGPAPRLGGFTGLQILAAAVLSGLAWTAPPVAAAGALVLVLAPAPWWPRLWGAATLALSGCFALIARAGRYHRWDDASALPARLARLAEAELRVPISRVRSTRLSLARLGNRWPYLRGRLLVARERPPLFVHRRGFRTRLVALARATGSADHGALLETVELDAVPPYALCLGPDAPPGPAILAALEPSGAGPMEPDPPAAV